MKIKEVETSDYSFNPIHDYTTDKPFMTGGQQLQADIGLSKFKRNVFIQKVIGYALPIYIVTYNSRYPNVNLGATRVRKLKSTWIGKVKRKAIHINLSQIKLTPPIPLASSMIQPVSGSIIIMRDVAGEYLRNPKVFECVEVNNKTKLKEIIE